MENKRNPFKRRRTNQDIDEFFFNSWNPFNEIQEYFNQMTQEMIEMTRNTQHGKIPTPQEGGPYIYGWSYHIGPDGQPHYQEFSNVPELTQQSSPKLSGKTEPFIDIIESEKELYITAELPGIAKEDIDVELTKDTLILTVKHPERGFKKELQLPAEINKNPVEAKYNNGVLSITLEKRRQKKKGRKINIQ